MRENTEAIEEFFRQARYAGALSAETQVDISRIAKVASMMLRTRISDRAVLSEASRQRLAIGVSGRSIQISELWLWQMEHRKKMFTR